MAQSCKCTEGWPRLLSQVEGNLTDLLVWHTVGFLEVGCPEERKLGDLVAFLGERCRLKNLKISKTISDSFWMIYGELPRIRSRERLEVRICTEGQHSAPEPPMTVLCFPILRTKAFRNSPCWKEGGRSAGHCKWHRLLLVLLIKFWQVFLPSSQNLLVADKSDGWGSPRGPSSISE